SSHLGRDLLITGGVDTQVTSCESRPFPNENPYRQPCFPPLNSVVSVAPEGKVILQRQANVLKLWALGKAEPISKVLGGQMESGQGLQIYERQRDLLRMELKTKTNLLYSTISPSGRLIAASDAEGPKLFSVIRAEDGTDKVRVQRVRGFPPENFVPEYSESRGATQIRFTGDECRVAIATADGFVSIVDISEWQHNVFTTVRRHCQHRNTQSEVEADAGCSDVLTHPGEAKSILPAVAEMRTIVSMAMSDSGKFVATCDTAGYVVVAGVDSQDAVVLPTLTQRKQQEEWPTALAFTAGDHLVLPTNLNHLFVWDAPKRAFTKWSRAFGSTNIPRTYSRMMSCVSGVAVNPAEPNCVYTFATNHITRIDLTLAPGSQAAVLNIHKRKKIEQDIIAKVVEEKERETSERLSEQHQSKRKRKQHVPGGDNGARMDVDGDEASAADSEEVASVVSEAASVRSQGKDWEGTIVARLREAGINVAEPHNFRMTERYQNLMHAAFVDANTMVVLERPWIDVSSALPAAFHRHNQNGFPGYEETLKENSIDGEVLVNLDHESLKDLGIRALGKRLLVLKSIYFLKLQHDIPITADSYVPQTVDVEPDYTQNSTYQRKHKRQADETVSRLMEDISTLSSEVSMIRNDMQRMYRLTVLENKPLPAPQRQATDPFASTVLMTRRNHSDYEQRRDGKGRNPILLNAAAQSASHHGTTPPPVPAAHSPGPGANANGISSLLLSGPQAAQTPVTPHIRVYGDNALQRENEAYKSFRISADDPCSVILPQALKKYHINDSWQNYTLCIQFGSSGKGKVERMLAMDEKPLHLFQQLKDAGESPVFVLKKKTGDLTHHTLTAKNGTLNGGGGSGGSISNGSRTSLFSLEQTNASTSSLEGPAAGSSINEFERV
ncbi:U3 small nucleolar RNA-associated protein, partial [Coemansia sp. RSA 2610]